jgi:pheromone shutdown protein TraB
MITLLGTGHVFKVAEPVSFIVRHTWPDAVLVELDVSRYNALSSLAEQDDKGAPKAKLKQARYQRDLAEDHGSHVGAELMAAVETGRMMGAVVEFIDTDASRMMDSLWKEMPFGEKMRFRLSVMGDMFRRKGSAEDALREFAENEEKYFAGMRKKYPTLVRKLIDERNIHMSERIKENIEKYENIIVVIGDGHVEGIASLLKGHEIRKIRLRTLMDRESMDCLRSELWSGAGTQNNTEGRERQRTRE